jgi:pilus assembly protein FimV
MLKLISIIILLPISLNLMALGLGQATVHSYLSQPLKASLPLTLSKGQNIDDVKATLASQADFANSNVEYGYAHSQVNISIQEGRDNQSPQLLISTIKPFNEPYLQLVINVKTARQQFNRRLTLLIDTPQNDMTNPSVFK